MITNTNSFGHLVASQGELQDQALRALAAAEQLLDTARGSTSPQYVYPLIGRAEGWVAVANAYTELAK